MSIEDDKLPHDEQLTGLYQHSRDDQPPRHLDDAVLAAARREVDSHSHPAFTPFSTNWRVPVSLAAVLVLSISIVNLMKDDEAFITDVDGILSATDDIAITGKPAPADSVPGRQGDEERLAALEKREVQRLREESTRQRKKTTSALKHEKPGQQEQPGARSAAKRKPASEYAPTAKAPALSGPVASPEENEHFIDNKAVLDSKQQDGGLDLRSNYNTGIAQQAEPIPDQAEPATSVTGISRIGESKLFPSVALISQLRRDGKLDEANRAADAFIKHHFGDDLDTVSMDRVKLPYAEFRTFIEELRLLERKEEAEKLQNLLTR